MALIRLQGLGNPTQYWAGHGNTVSPMRFGPNAVRTSLASWCYESVTSSFHVCDEPTALFTLQPELCSRPVSALRAYSPLSSKVPRILKRLETLFAELWWWAADLLDEPLTWWVVCIQPAFLSPTMWPRLAAVYNVQHIRSRAQPNSSCPMLSMVSFFGRSRCSIRYNAAAQYRNYAVRRVSCGCSSVRDHVSSLGKR